MSTEKLKQEIRRFLASDDPEVICVTGKWGVGKTYAWTKYLADADSKKTINIPRYSYVSLFGRQSLDDVRSAIFENTVALTGKPASPTLDSVAASIGSRSRRLASLLKSAPKIKDYVAVSERILYATMAPQIVAIDDLERLGRGLSVSDILGLVSELKEQKRCKVIVLLNAEKIDPGNKLAFETQLEKVADVTFVFDPTPAEAADIGLSQTAPLRAQLVAHTTTLSIVNVRVIKKIERGAIRLAEILKGQDDRILSQALSAAALFTWAKLQPDDAPSIEFLKEFNQFGGMFGQPSEEYVRWRDTLVGYGHGVTDKFDLLVLDGVERGFFDADKIVAAANELAAKLGRDDRDALLSKGWATYHDSFDDNADQVVEELDASCRANVDVLSPINASGAIKLMKDLGLPERGKALANYYVNNKPADDDFWDLSKHALRGEINDPDLVAAFEAKHAAIAAAPDDPSETLIRIYEQNGWNPRDIELLASLTADDFVEMFKRLRGSDLRRASSEALRFKNRGAVGSKEHGIGVAADLAMERIAAESPINARRVAQRRQEALR